MQVVRFAAAHTYTNNIIRDSIIKTEGTTIKESYFANVIIYLIKKLNASNQKNNLRQTKTTRTLISLSEIIDASVCINTIPDGVCVTVVERGFLNYILNHSLFLHHKYFRRCNHNCIRLPLNNTLQSCHLVNKHTI